MRIVLCPSCHRHVKVHDVRCPFCQAAMPVPARSRVAAAVVVGLGLAVGACSSSSTPSEGKDAGDGGSHPMCGDAMCQPGYGAVEPDGSQLGADAGDAGPGADAADTDAMASDADAASDTGPQASGAYGPPVEWNAGSGPEGA